MSEKLLVSPACERGCADCYESCAVAKCNSVWWRDHLQDLMRERPTSDAAKAVRAESLEEAQRVLARLASQMRKFPVRRARPKLRLIQGGRA